MSIVINILAAIGLIIIISYVVYYLYQYYEYLQIQKTNAQMNPSNSYMQNTGLMCPDYWVNSGVDSNGNYICNNEYNIPVNSNCNSQTMSFTSIPNGQTWEYGNPNGLTTMNQTQKYTFLNNSAVTGSLSRCQWINQCGPNTTTQGIWQGVNDMCNSPPPSTTS